MAVSAVSGCMTVQRAPSPGPPPAPSTASEPRPDGSTRTHVVQAPVQEALEHVGPPRRSSAPASAPARQAAPAASPAAPAAPARRPAADPPERPDSREPERHAAPRPPVPGPGTDVCALGRSYGGWPADSPQAAICKDVYGG
ncbi:lipoprotein [Streptomyces fructofermentans]|uniref:Lipoprotein n=1 Tax=Streptomyces fructofermentans TaxID=152141 RepID=A0A918KNG1_9ACTN|nr:lipoprotein [Streptomyces fructofermentans]